MANRVNFGAWTDGSMRLRISAPTFDVMSTTLTYDKIHFDSTLDGYGVVLQSGTFTLPAGTAYTNSRRVTWSTLSFKPTVHLLFGASDARRSAYGDNNISLSIGNDGIYATGTAGAAIVVYYAMINAQVA